MPDGLSGAKQGILAVFFVLILNFAAAVAIVAVHDLPSSPQTVLLTPASQTYFPISASNSSLTFDGAVSYGNVTLEDNVWHFTDLVLGGWTNSTLRTFRFSASDCNVTVNPFLVRLYEDVGVGFDAVLNYTVVGRGTQTFWYKCGAYSTNYTYLDVTIDGAARGVGDGWTLSDAGELTVTDAASSVCINSWYPINGGPAPGPGLLVTALLVVVVTPLVVALVVLTVVVWRRVSKQGMAVSVLGGAKG